MRNASHLLGSDAHPSITMNYLEHIENCKNSRVTRQTFPEKGEVLTFKKVESLHHHPMLIYLDFETANQSLSEVREGVKKKNWEKAVRPSASICGNCDPPKRSAGPFFSQLFFDVFP